jgi:hypothetical protein
MHRHASPLPKMARVPYAERFRALCQATVTRIWPDHLKIFLRKAARRAGVPPHVVTGEKPPKTFLGSGDDSAN